MSSRRLRKISVSGVSGGDTKRRMMTVLSTNEYPFHSGGGGSSTVSRDRGSQLPGATAERVAYKDL